jgi:heptosyltransferase-1
LPPADLHSHDFQKILLIKLSAVGDVVHTLPVLNKLRRRYPRAQLDWLVTPGIAELLRHHPAITRIIEFEREARSKPWRLAPFASYVRLAAGLRRAEYDLVIDMHGQFRTVTLATGAPARNGFDRPRARVWDASSRKFPPGGITQ